jgi:hypothetical protein
MRKIWRLLDISKISGMSTLQGAFNDVKRRDFTMNRTGSIVAALCLLLALCQTGFAETEVQGEVSGVWDVEGSPYCIVDSIWISASSSLRM